MRDYYDGLEDLLAHTSNELAVEDVVIESAVGRILAQDLTVQYPAPQFDNSAMDGYAICDVSRQSWQVIGTISAGDESAQYQLQPGEAVRIFTGAGIPGNCDSVIQQELVSRDGDAISVTEPFAADKNIRRAGEELQKGEVLFEANRLITPAVIGLLASQGFASVPCFKKLQVTVFSTGDELTPLGQPLEINQIYDSNRPMLLSQLGANEFLEVKNGGALADDLSVIQSNIQEVMATSDVIVFSGGASVGEKDFLKQALDNLGEIEHWKMGIKPGKPFGWGKLSNGTKVFLLPGNPVASFATCVLLAIPAIRRLAGLKYEQALPFSFMAQAGFEVTNNKAPRRDFRRGVLRSDATGTTVELLTTQDSHMLSGISYGDVLVEVPPQQDVQRGDLIKVYPIQRIA